MTRDDIMRLAQESGLWLVIEQHSCEYGDGLPTLDRYPELERFAALVAAAAKAEEREEAATYRRLYEERGKALARPCINCGHQPAAIRARGKKS